MENNQSGHEHRLRPDRRGLLFPALIGLWLGAGLIPSNPAGGAMLVTLGGYLAFYGIIVLYRARIFSVALLLFIMAGYLVSLGTSGDMTAHMFKFIFLAVCAVAARGAEAELRPGRFSEFSRHWNFSTLTEHITLRDIPDLRARTYPKVPKSAETPRPENQA